MRGIILSAIWEMDWEVGLWVPKVSEPVSPRGETYMAVDVAGLHGCQLNFEGRTTSQIKRGVTKEREREILAGVLGVHGA